MNQKRNMAMKITLILTLLFHFNAFAQINNKQTLDREHAEELNVTTVSPKVAAIVERIAEINVLFGPNIRFHDIGERQYENFLELQNLSSRAELEFLTNHQNGVVRCYAFWALAINPDTNLLKLLSNRIQDSESIKEMLKRVFLKSAFGQSAFPMPDTGNVGDLCIRLVTDESTDFTGRRLVDEQIAELTFMLAINPNELYKTKELVMMVEPTAKQCIRLRDTYKKHAFLPALVALAGAKNEQDIELIAASLNRDPEDRDGYELAHKAIRRFPHPAFLPHLKKQVQVSTSNWRSSRTAGDLCLTIAACQNTEAADLLQLCRNLTAENRRPYDQEDYVFDAIMQYKCSAFDEMLWEYWETEGRLTAEGLAYLKETNPERTFTNALSEIRAVSDILLEEGVREQRLRRSSNVLVELMQIVAEQDRDIAVTATANLLKVVDWSRSSTVIEIADQLQDPRLIAPLLNLLERESGAQRQLSIVLSLLKYKDTDTNKRLVKAWRTWPNLQYSYIQETLERIFTERGLLPVE